MKKSDNQQSSPNAALEESIRQVDLASINKQIIHISRVFINAPVEAYGVNAVFVVCPDELAKELHKRLAETVGDFFRSKGICPVN
jgi:hypothetical protein